MQQEGDSPEPDPPDLRLPASRTVRNACLWPKPPRPWCPVMAAHGHWGRLQGWRRREGSSSLLLPWQQPEVLPEQLVPGSRWSSPPGACEVPAASASQGPGRQLCAGPTSKQLGPGTPTPFLPSPRLRGGLCSLRTLSALPHCSL